MKTVLVIGASGYVGACLFDMLISEGYEAYGLGRVHPKKSMPYFCSDITDYEKLCADLGNRQFDCIMHLASLPGNTGNPVEMVKVNINGYLNTLEYARLHGKAKVVFASSISAYEWYPSTPFKPPLYIPVDEEHPCNPQDMYSTTKRMQELLSLTYYKEFKLPVTGLRLTAVVGPEGRGGGRGWGEFAEQLFIGKKVSIPHFSAEEECHYVDIRDVARMFIACALNPNADGEIFNCVGPAPITGEEIAGIIHKLYPDINVEYGFPWSMAQGGKISFDMKKARKLLDFEPIYSMPDSIDEIKRWLDAGGMENRNINKNNYIEGVSKSL